MYTVGSCVPTHRCSFTSGLQIHIYHMELMIPVETDDSADNVKQVKESLINLLVFSNANLNSTSLL